MACAMSSAERVAVPLKSMCSMKWAMPLCSSGSSREPRVSQTPTDTERTWSMRSVIRRTPLSNTSRTIIGWRSVCITGGIRTGGKDAKSLFFSWLQRTTHHTTRPPRPGNRKGADRMLESNVRYLADSTGDIACLPQPHPPDLTALELPDLEARFRDLGIAPFHARQVFRWVHRRGVTDPGADDRPRPRAARTARGRVHRHRSAVASLATSRPTGPQKFLLELADGRRIESVFIPDTPAMTFCISSQVGCAMDCGFCLTGKMGFVRNLTPGEIVAQVRVLARRSTCSRPVSTSC